MSDEIQRQREIEIQRQREVEAHEIAIREAREEELRKISKALLGDDRKPDYPDDSDDA